MAYAGITEKAKMVRNKLRQEFGYTSRQVSVRGRHCGYSTALDVTIKDFNVDIKKVRSVAYEVENVDYDMASGEILSGGNTYVHVNYDYNLTSDKTKELTPMAEKMFAKIDKDPHNGLIVAENGNKRLVYFRHDGMLYFIDDDKSYQEHTRAGSCPANLARAIVAMIYEYKRMAESDLII